MNDTGRPDDVLSASDEELFATVRGTPPADRGPIDASQALGVLFERYHARVLRSCERILGETGRAEDAMHEIFLGLLDGSRSYRERASFGAWLFVLTRNHCLNALRRYRREIDVDPYEELVNHPDTTASPQEFTEREEITERIERACEEHLNATERRVIDLQLRWGLSVKAIDSLLGLTNTSGARTHLSTAKRKLRIALADLAPSSGGGEDQR